jgi:ribonuclease T1
MKNVLSRGSTLLALLVLAVLGWIGTGGHSPAPVNQAFEAGTETSSNASAGFLTPEALQVVDLIVQGGPYRYSQDGTTFFNREGRLPQRSRGYYREFTVDTPGLRHRGARRIVTGGNPPRDWYYTDDHYESFRAFEVAPR